MVGTFFSAIIGKDSDGPKFAGPNVPPRLTAGQVGSQFKLFLQRKRLARILGNSQTLGQVSLLGS